MFCCFRLRIHPLQGVGRAEQGLADSAHDHGSVVRRQGARVPRDEGLQGRGLHQDLRRQADRVHHGGRSPRSL